MSERGFTLVEVMAALLIFSLAIVGLTRAGTQSVSHAQRLTDKAYADIVADNVLIRTRMMEVQIGTRSGEEEAGGRAYDWRVETRRTPQAGLVELEVNVLREDDVVMTRRAWRATDDAAGPSDRSGEASP